MSLNRYAKSRDVNEAAIVTELRAHPDVVLVYRIDQPVDLLVQLRDGTWHLLEIKNVEHGEARRKPRTSAQLQFREQACPPPPTVTTPREAFAALGLRLCGPPRSDHG